MTDKPDDYEFGADGNPILVSVPVQLTPFQEAATVRRNEVQRLIALGCSPAEAAKRTGVSRSTVDVDIAVIRRFNKQRMDDLRPADLFGEVDAAYKHILKRTMDIADAADGAEDELKALGEARKVIVAQMAAYKQLGIDRDMEAEAKAAAARPPMHIEHIHKVQLPDNVRRLVLAAALEGTLTGALAAPTPDDAIDCPAIEPTKAR